MCTGNITPEAVLLQVEESTAVAAVKPAVRRGYRFRPFYHPYVAAFVHELNKNGVDGLLQRALQLDPDEFMPSAPSSSGASATKHKPLKFKQAYQPAPPHVDEPIVGEPYPEEEVCFDDDDAYALYNWELFFHAPLLIANRLFQNEQNEESDRWLKFIYNSTGASSLPAPNRFWQTKPFHERADKDYERQRIESLLAVLAKAAKSEQSLGVDEKEDLRQFRRTIAAWAKDPFNPHLVARLRTTAYQKAVVMKYFDNHLAWADKLFRLDTIESINEATQHYVLVADSLGRLPQHVPPRARPRTQTYNTLEPALDELGNALVEIEEFVSPSEAPAPAAGSPAVTTMFYFCVPKNDKLLGYWDVVADRLFKIRHCMNIEGVVRQLPLFEPPIDPALLVKAAAAGVDIGSVLADVSAPLPHYRFQVLAQKAAAICGELKGLGSTVLATLEKRDGEALSLLRAQHETGLLALVKQVREQQIDEAVQNLVALRGSRAVAVGRWQHYQRLLGVQSPAAPSEGEEIQEVQPSPLVQMKDQDGVKMIPSEIEELYQLEDAQQDNERASWLEISANLMHYIPDIEIAAKPMGAGIGTVATGGTHIGPALSAFASRYRYDAGEATYKAGLAAKKATYALRGNEHAMQANQAAREIMQIDKQIVAAEIKHEVAKKELSNHEQQLANAEQVEAELKNKYTNQQLYGWMLGQLASVYFQTYQVAYDLARRAERCYRYELGLKDSSFIKFGYWDSLKKGLLAGERLMQDLTRMEVAYLEKNKRELELTKHVSLLQLDPLALVALRESGSCVVNVPEALFDMDYPGHYMRRIKLVSVSIPCVTGPYTGVSCALSLLKSSVRHANTLIGGKTYARGEEDLRFTDTLGAIESIVTSSGQNDSGSFDAPNLKDERYLPFEGAGAISEWRVELPAPLPQFDYATIKDVVLHLRYTARAGGGLLTQQAANELQTTLNELVLSERETGLAQLFSLRHEFPDQWHRFLNPGQAELQRMTLALEQDRFPFLFKARKLNLDEVGVYLKVKKAFKATHDESTLRLVFQAGDSVHTPEQAPEVETLPVSAWNGMLRAQAQPDEPPGVFSLTGWRDDGGAIDRIDPDAVEDLVLVCRYTISA